MSDDTGPKGVKPETLDDLARKVKKAGADALRDKDIGLPFEEEHEPAAGKAPPRHVARIPFTHGHKAKVIDNQNDQEPDPAKKKDPDSFDFSVTGPDKQPVSIPTVPGMGGGKTTTTLDPEEVTRALKEVEKLDRGEKLGNDAGVTDTTITDTGAAQDGSASTLAVKYSATRGSARVRR